MVHVCNPNHTGLQEVGGSRSKVSPGKKYTVLSEKYTKKD
jgi:hypothetical protein